MVPTAALVYLCVPGHPDAWFAGVPLGAHGAAVAATLVFVAVMAATRDRAPAMRRLALLMVVAAGIKPLLALGAAPAGWQAAYFANPTFSPPHERSSDFRGLDATRIDREIDFAGDRFPLHYLNERRFEYPHGDSQLFKREPVSVRWTAVLADEPRPVMLQVIALGRILVRVNGTLRLDESVAGAATSRAIQILDRGETRLEVQYVKPANVDGAVGVNLAPEVRITAWPQQAGRWQMMAAVLLDGFVLAAVMCWAWLVLRRRQQVWTADRLVRYGTVALFTVQGWWAAQAFAGRMRDMSTGDDWFFFEAGARELALRGWLQTFGEPLGQGSAFIAYPLYQYWLAVVHLTIGEDGFGPVFVQFIVLACANLVVYRLAQRLFDTRVALLTLVGLVLLEQLAFIRYYTVTLFAENIYVLFVPAVVYYLVRFAASGSITAAAAAGALGGIAAITKSQFMLFLPLALAFVTWVAWRRSGVPSTAAQRAAVFVSCWFLAIAPITIRNYVVSGRPVLITEGQVTLFVVYNLPPGVDPQPYADAIDDSAIAAAGTLLEIAAQYPIPLLEVLGRKIAFSLGAVHIFPGYRPHPELLVLTFGYLGAVAWLPRARRADTWPVHLFVAAHLAGMLLTLPSSYGYRLILPPYLLMTPFACALPVALGARMLPPRPA
jgi:hypothetical protein